MSGIGDNAHVFGNARLSGKAQVSDNARVFGDARVSGNAWVFGDAQVSGNAWVFGNARVSGNARLSGNARIVCGYVADGADVFAPHHVQTYRDCDDVLWTVYRRRDKKPRIMRWEQPVKYADAPAIVRALAEEVAA